MIRVQISKQRTVKDMREERRGQAKSDRVLPCWSRRQVQIASIGNNYYAMKVEGSVPVYSLPNVLIHKVTEPFL